MPISNVTADTMVNGPDHAFHALVRGGMLRHARFIRDTTDGSQTEAQQRWARRVMADDTRSYRPILIELSLQQTMQDLYTAGGPYGAADETSVKGRIAAVLEAAIAAEQG